jgi:hypothetical protein
VRWFAALQDVFHSDGKWNMPAEFETRENHPYRYNEPARSLDAADADS